MDTTNSIQAEVTGSDNISYDLIKYTSELLEKVILGYLNFKKTIFEKKERIARLQINNFELYKNNLKKRCRKVKFIDRVTSTYSNYTKKLFAGLIMIQEYTKRHSEIISNYKPNLKLDVHDDVLIYDEFTAMPYHDVESKTHQLNITINQLNEEVDQICKETIVLYRYTEKQHREMMQEIDKFNICLQEQRAEIQRLKEFNWKNPILQSHFYEKKIAQIQKEIAGLETKI